MSKILVIGSGGQLGQCLQKVAAKQGIEDIWFASRQEGNITDPAGLHALFERTRPAYVINCAAYTAVDLAEDETQQAREINKEGSANLARLCKAFDAVLIHVSTDFVFGGNSVQPLTETDTTEPINIYGLTKLEGEQAIAAITEKHFIIRTSWLYSEFANNFVKTMLRLGKERSELNVIADQIGTPTYAMDLAAGILHIIESKNGGYGTYHYSNEGVASWYDFAKAVFEMGNLPVKVQPIKSSQYITKAKRPAFSVMDKSKIKLATQLEIPYWRDSLVKCINQINATQ